MSDCTYSIIAWFLPINDDGLNKTFRLLFQNQRTHRASQMNIWIKKKNVNVKSTSGTHLINII